MFSSMLNSFGPMVDRKTAETSAFSPASCGIGVTLKESG